MNADAVVIVAVIATQIVIVTLAVINRTNPDTLAKLESIERAIVDLASRIAK